MELSDLTLKTLRTVAAFPPIATLRRKNFERKFATHRDAQYFHGIFDTFEEAKASAPSTKPIGYDNHDAASLYRKMTSAIYPRDYPMMFWLERRLQGGARRIFDLGGHIGITYYAFRNYLNYPQDLRWIVHDVPAVLEDGRRWAADHDSSRQLEFAQNLSEGAVNCDVLYANGSLQYIKDDLSRLLNGVDPLPRSLLINQLPVHDTLSYWTLQSIGIAFCPYRIFRQSDFVSSLTELGYTLRDQWQCPEKSCDIAFEHRHSLDHYRGYYFELERGSPQASSFQGGALLSGKS